MFEKEIEFKPGSPQEAIAWIDRFAKDHGLIVRSTGSLGKYPGCVHCHLMKAGQTGTLEVTYWPQTGQFWWKVATNRDSEWIRLLFNRELGPRE